MKTFARRLAGYLPLMLSVLVLVQISIVQMREARANPVFLPMIIGIEIIGAMGVGAAVEMYDGAPSASSAVGAQALSVNIGNATDGTVRVPTTSGAASAASIPVPSAAANVAATTATTTVYCGRSSPCSYASSSEAATDWAAYQNEQSASWVYTFLSCDVGGYCHWSARRVADNYVIYDNHALTQTTTTQTTCAASGYTYPGSGTQCNLTNARAAVPDGKQDLSRSGQALSADPADLKGSVNAVLSASYVSNDTADVSGMSASGQPRLVRATALADGGSEVKQITQKSDGAGNTYLETRTYNISSTGTITGASSGSTAGSLNAVEAGSGSKYVVSGSGASVTPAAPGSGSGSGTGTGSGIGGATDYARQGEAASAAASVVAALTMASGSYPPSGASTGYGTLQTAVGELCTGPACAQDSPLNPGTSWLPTILPGNAVACTPLDFHAVWGTLDSTTSLDLCPYLEMGRNIIGWLLNIAVVIYIWRRFTNMNNGG